MEYIVIMAWDEVLGTSEFQNLLKNFPLGVYSFRYVAPDSLVLTDANPQARKIFGIDYSLLKGEGILEAFPGFDTREFFKRCLSVAENGTTWFAPAFPYADGIVSGQFDIWVFRVSVDTIVLVFAEVSEREANRIALGRERATLRTLIDAVPDIIFFKDVNSVYLGCNRAFERFYGITEAEIIGKTDHDIEAPEKANFFKLYDELALDKGEPQRIEELISCSDGSKVLFDIVKAPFFSDSGMTLGVVGISRDITALREREDLLTEALGRQRLAAAVFENAQEGIIITDSHGVIVEVNEAFRKLTGYPENEILGFKPGKFSIEPVGSDFWREILDVLEKSGNWKGEIPAKRRNGETYIQHSSITTVRDQDGMHVYYVGLCTDVTEINRSRERLEFLAYYDELTGLPNRTLLRDRLQVAIAQSKRDAVPLALCYVDLDKFKPVNDRYGHEVGDILLQEVSIRMRNCLRSGDTVARLGGDEFIIILSKAGTRNECEQTLSRILEKVSESFEIMGHTLFISASIGVAMFPKDSEDRETLIRYADEAMYEAKRSGENRFNFWEPPVR